MLEAVSSSQELADRIGSALGGEERDGQWLCKCPAHDDQNASLSIGVTKNKGVVGVKCFAGCSNDAVIDKLRAMSLWPERKLQVSSGLKLVARYIYRDREGAVVYEKLRFKKPDGSKTFAFRHTKDGEVVKGKPSGADVPYGAHQLAEQPHATVIACEGEKDCDSLEGLEGYVAVTNSCGATSGSDLLAEWLAGRDVIISEHNDDAGRARTKKLGLALLNAGCKVRVARFTDLPEKGDHSDYLASGGTLEALRKRFEEAEPLAREKTKLTDGEAEALNKEAESGDGKQDKAGYEEHVAFVRSLPVYKEIRRDILSDDLLAKDTSGNWAPLLNDLDYIRGHARSFGKRYTLQAFPEYLDRYRRDDCRPELCLDIPTWDGKDRLLQASSVFRFSNCSQEDFYQLICEWGVSIFRRLKDHSYQPLTPIFRGPQGCGKDTFIQAIASGFGMYFQNLNFSHSNQSEAERQLHTALVFNIPEFDRTNKMEIATVKHLLSTPFTNARLPYDKRHAKRMLHCSFISSANVEDVMTDTTGGRRFWMFQAEFMGIEVKERNGKLQGTGRVLQDYPGLYCREKAEEERMQIVAQFQAMHARGFRADPGAIERMQAYVAEQTPDDWQDLASREWESLMKDHTGIPVARDATDGAELYPLSQVEPYILKLAKDYERKKQKVLELLKRRKYAVRRKDGVFYRGMPHGSGITGLPF